MAENMEEMTHFTRIEKVKKAMAARGVDVFLVSPSSNLFYLSGCNLRADERLFLLVLPLEKDPFIISNLLYREQVKNLPVKDLVCWKDGENPFRLLADEIKKRNIIMKKAALEPKIPALFSLPIAKVFPDTSFELGSPIIDHLRQIKDEAELELIRFACRQSDRVIAALIDRGNDWLGRSELDFYQELGAEMRQAGITSFGASVQTGANAAVPHHRTGNFEIKNGNCLLVDFWGRHKEYFTDCTRTFHFGKPSGEFEKIYAIVLEAHLKAEAKARSGNLLEDVDIAARSVIEKNGYGQYFTHRTGHGLGIDAHEGDSANTGVKTVIKPGMVFSVEPGIYLPGRFGVRIENLVAIGENGTEVLHNFPRELRIIN